MAKYYIAKMLILDPKDALIAPNILSAYQTEDIVVKEVPFGYMEIMTNHFFRKGKKLENAFKDQLTIGHHVCDRLTAALLELDGKQFVLDNELFPLKEAKLKDVEEYLKRFDSTALKLHYDERRRLVEEKIEGFQQEREGQRKIKTLIDNYKNQNQGQN